MGAINGSVTFLQEMKGEIGVGARDEYGRIRLRGRYTLKGSATTLALAAYRVALGAL